MGPKVIRARLWVEPPTPHASSCCAMISSDTASSVDEVKFQIYSVHAQPLYPFFSLCTLILELDIRSTPSFLCFFDPRARYALQLHLLIILELDIHATPSPYVSFIQELDTLYTFLSS